MSYSTTVPPVLFVQPIGGLNGANTIRFWCYVSSDSFATIMASGYFTNGFRLGMRTGDYLLIQNPTTFQQGWFTCTVSTSGSPNDTVQFTDNLISGSATNSITALAGGGQAGATALTSRVNRVTTVATASDSVALPAALPGMQVTVINASSIALAVFPQTTETINALATGSSFAMATGKAATFVSGVQAVWNTIISAATV